jgi:hypothetical protein
MADQPSPRRRFQFESPEARAALWSFRISLVLIGASIGGLFSAAVAALSATVGPPLMPPLNHAPPARRGDDQ